MILALVTSSLAATLEVGPGKAYSSITAALAASHSGDTVSVSAGTYTEEFDLRGKNVSLVAPSGPYSTEIVAANPIYIDGGSLEGFTLSGSIGTAVGVTAGSPTLRELVIESPVLYGVLVSAGSPIIEECLVSGAGNSGFAASGGTPNFRRSIAVDSAKYGFYLKGGGSAYNCFALRGKYGFVLQVTTATASNVVATGTTTAAVGTLAATTITNLVSLGNPYVNICNGGEGTFPNGIGYDDHTTSGCVASALDNVDDVDPKFTAYAAGAELWEIDLHPKAGSPMVNAGSGVDSDGSAADLGIFGSNTGVWRDRDGDGVVVLFDCDDHSGSRHPGATEIADGLDQDCDGEIDEGVIIDTGDTGDTGTIDTGDTGDTGTIDTGDTGPDTGDTGTGVDIDHDGYAASVDCGDHNVATYPGAVELLDSVDNDCDGRVDEGTANGDDDGDSWTILDGDCDDTDRTRHPQADEVPRDGVDQDCDGVDETPRGQDNDDDGYTDASDCDDSDPDVHPTAADPTNGVDDDCDGLADDDALNRDADGDGQTPAEGDCRDDNPQFYTGANDLADNYIDEDCSGADNYDVDRDGIPAPASGGDDCDDLRSTTYPGAQEICTDSLDNDCDDEVNEDCEAYDGGDDSTGCGCSSGGAGLLPGLALGLLAAGILRRRVSKS